MRYGTPTQLELLRRGPVGLHKAFKDYASQPHTFGWRKHRSRGGDADVAQTVSVHPHGVRSFYLGNAAFHCVLHLFEGAYFDLPHPLARYAELVGEFFQRDGIVGQPPSFEDTALAPAQYGQRAD